MTERRWRWRGDGLEKLHEKAKTNIYFSDIPIYVFAFVVEMLKNVLKEDYLPK